MSIEEILGIALGQLRLSYDDFCALSPGEFNQVHRAWTEHETLRLHEDWERTRTQAFVFAQPYLKKGVTAQRMFPLPWDKKVRKGAPSTEARRQRILKRTQEYYGIDNQHNLQAPGEPQGPQGADQ